MTEVSCHTAMCVPSHHRIILFSLLGRHALGRVALAPLLEHVFEAQGPLWRASSFPHGQSVISGGAGVVSFDVLMRAFGARCPRQGLVWAALWLFVV